jgi:hypothetical protein
MIFVCLLALALPLASVILSVQSFTRKESSRPVNSDSEVAQPLRSMLEIIADEKLGPQDLGEDEITIELVANELKAEKARIEQLLPAYGGSSIPRLESEAEIRLLVQVPADNVDAFLVACCAGKERGSPANPSGGLLEIVIKRIGSQ